MLKISAILAITLAVIAQSYAEINPECAEGPKFWCESIQNANKCNAFKHCLQTIWTTHAKYFASQNNLIKSDSSCSKCLQCINTDLTVCPFTTVFKHEINEMVKNKIPTETICKLMRQCNEDQGEYKYDSRFKCGLHPRNWCDNLETSKRCDSFENCFSLWSKTTIKYKVKEIETLNFKSPKEVVDQKTCGFCVFIFNKLQEVLQQNSTEVNIKDYLESACTLLPNKDVSQKCVEQVDAYLPELYIMLRNNIDPGIICRVLKQCSDKYLDSYYPSDLKPEPRETNDVLKAIKIRVLNEKNAKVSRTPLKADQTQLGLKSEGLVVELKQSMGVGCELCTIVMNAAKYLAINKHSDEKVLLFIEKQLCGRLGSLNNTCVEYVQEEGAEIIKFLLQEIDPSLICRAMGLCLKIQVTDEYINEKFYDLNVRNTLNCTLCKIVFEQVKHMLSQEQSQAKILSYIDVNLCLKVGKSKELCKSLIDAYGPLFLEIISRDVHPDQLCTMIGMCGKNIEIEQENKKQGEIEAKDTPNCVLCEFVMKLLEERINKNVSEAEIEQLLSYVCDHAIPKSVRAQCTGFVANYGKIIASLIINQVSPKNVCKFIGLCAATFYEREETTQVSAESRFSELVDLMPAKKVNKKENILVENNSINNKTLQCSLCVYVAEVVSQKLKQNKTEEQIVSELKLVCNLFPNSLKDQCNSFVIEYGPYIVQLVAAQIDPEVTCAALKVCPKPTQKDLLSEALLNRFQN